MNAHKTIYIVTPEYTSGSQIILRDNLAPMVKASTSSFWPHPSPPATPFRQLWKP